jgi:hypothetical protein
MANKMKYGEALRMVFEAFYKDRSTVETSYHAPSLNEAIEQVPVQWRYELMSDFGVIMRRMETKMLACSHPTASVTTPYNGCERCSLCGCKRFMESVETDYPYMDASKQWSKWKVWDFKM